MELLCCAIGGPVDRTLMALKDAVVRAGVIPPDNSVQSVKKAYSETLSHELAIEVALRDCGFSSVKPERFVVPRGKHKGEIKIVKEKEFQGGLGSKRVDVSGMRSFQTSDVVFRIARIAAAALLAVAALRAADVRVDVSKEVVGRPPATFEPMVVRGSRARTTRPGCSSRARASCTARPTKS